MIKLEQRRALALALAATFLLVAAFPAVAKEGFGRLTKKTAKLVRVHPPEVFLTGTRIAVRATSAPGVGAAVSQRLSSQLESELLSRDGRLSADPQDPQTLIEVEVLRDEESQRTENHEEPYQQKVGTNSKGKPIYRSYVRTVPYTVVEYSFTASFKVTDVAKGLNLAADSIQYPFKESFREGQGVPGAFTLEDRGIATVVEQICRRVTPTREVIGVLLPKGSLADLANLAIAGSWNRYLEALEGRTPFSDPKDESYRQYAIGTAYEALGYTADDPAVTLRYLEQADLHYGKAIEANPGEKLFVKDYSSLLGRKSAEAPLDRVRSALVAYRRIKDFEETAPGSAEVAQSAGAKGLDDKATSETMDNAAVLRMVRAGLPDEVILAAIDSAADTSFDVSPNGLIELSKGKVAKAIILKLQKLATHGKKAHSSKR